MRKTKKRAFLKHKWFAHLANNSGSVMVIFAAFLFVALGFSTLVIDLGALRLEKSRLVNAVDAAALAAVRELPDTQKAELVAREYTGVNGVTSTETIVTFDNEQGTITVKATRERNLIFGQILGINTGRVSAEATAAAGNLGSMRGVLPIGLKKDYYINSLNAGDGISIVNKSGLGDPGKDFGPGNWGFIYLATNLSTQDQLDYMKNGFSGPISVGKTVTTDTGSNLLSTSSSLWNTLDKYIANKEVVYIPILDAPVGSGSMDGKVVGFAGIVITGYTKNASSSIIKARINPVEVDTVPGTWHPDAGNFGLQYIALIN